MHMQMLWVYSFHIFCAYIPIHACIFRIIVNKEYSMRIQTGLCANVVQIMNSSKHIWICTQIVIQIQNDHGLLGCDNGCHWQPLFQM